MSKSAVKAAFEWVDRRAYRTCFRRQRRVHSDEARHAERDLPGSRSDISRQTGDSTGVLDPSKMKAIRQIEAAEHMVAGGTYTIPFAKALLVVTKPEMLAEHPSSGPLEATSMAARSMLKEENDFLLRDLKAVEEP